MSVNTSVFEKYLFEQGLLPLSFSQREAQPPFQFFALPRISDNAKTPEWVRKSIPASELDSWLDETQNEDGTWKEDWELVLLWQLQRGDAIYQVEPTPFTEKTIRTLVKRLDFTSGLICNYAMQSVTPYIKSWEAKGGQKIGKYAIPCLVELCSEIV